MRTGVVPSTMHHMLHAHDDDLLVAAAHADPAPRLVNPSPRSDGARRGRHTPTTPASAGGLVTGFAWPWGGEVVVGAKSGRRWS